MNLSILNSLWWSALSVFPIGGVAVYLGYCMLFGRRTSARADAAGGSPFLGLILKEYAYAWAELPAKVAMWLRLSPNAITVLGALIVTAGSLSFALGGFALGGFCLLIGSVADMVDGMVARRFGKCSDTGELIDSLVDRYTDMIALLALAVFYRDRPWAMAVVFWALIASVLVSYARAKGESLGIRNIPQGIMQRAERTVYLGFSIILAPPLERLINPEGPPLYAIALLACALIGIFTSISVARILTFTTQALRQPARVAA